MIKPEKINKMEVEIINFRNIDAVKFRVTGDAGIETANILLPHIREKSPVLMWEEKEKNFLKKRK